MSILNRILKEFICPITFELMEDPYFCLEDGYTYEKSAIIYHLLLDNYLLKQI
jgi:hypothetical protein